MKEDNPQHNRRRRRGSDSDDERFIAKTPAEMQRQKLDRLLKHIDKPAPIPDPPKEKGPPKPMEFVRNVVGSSAGAGSAEYHIYRNNRKKEILRLEYHDRVEQKEKMQKEYEEKVNSTKAEEEERTAKKRAKRLKAKERLKQKRKNKNSNNNEGAKKSKPDDADSDSSDSDQDQAQSVGPNTKSNNEVGDGSAGD